MIYIKDENSNFEKLNVVKKYFAKIFNILSKDVRRQLLSLNIPKEELKEIKKELAFLPEEEQMKYLEELSRNKKQRDFK